MKLSNMCTTFADGYLAEAASEVVAKIVERALLGENEYTFNFEGTYNNLHDLLTFLEKQGFCVTDTGLKDFKVRVIW